MTHINWGTPKEMFELIKHFCDFTIQIKSHVKTRLYRALLKVLSAIYKLVEKYKRYLTHCIILALWNQYTKEEYRYGSQLHFNYYQ